MGNTPLHCGAVLPLEPSEKAGNTPLQCGAVVWLVDFLSASQCGAMAAAWDFLLE